VSTPISIDWLIKIACLAVLVYWSALLIQPFLTIIIWSIILAVALYPIFDWSVRRLHLYRVVAAALITLAAFVIVIGPVTWLGGSLARTVPVIVDRLNNGSISIPPPMQSVRDWPLVGEGLYDFWTLASTNLGAALNELGPQLKPLATGFVSVAGSAGINALEFIVAVLISGFLFIPGPGMVNAFKSATLHVASRRGAEFVDLAGATIRNLARGVIGVSLLQALLAGLGLIVAGVPAAGLFSFLVLLLGILQIGASLIIGLLIVWSWLTMDTTSALLFTIYMGPVGLVDNFLRPIAMAHGLKTPMVVIVMGVLGGVIVHGMIGLFVGPIVLAIAWELLIVWMREEIREPESIESKEYERVD
jgi:predicted PurR-regulated permease PerM